MLLYLTFMLNANILQKHWQKLEAKKTAPKFVKKINTLEFSELKKAIDNKNIFYVKNLTKKMYDGEAFIVRNSAKKNLKNIIIKLAKHYDKKKNLLFIKCLMGHQIFIELLTKK